MLSIQPRARTDNARPVAAEPGLRRLSRCDLYAAIDFWLKRLHVARRTDDPDGAGYATARYDRYCDELDRRDAIRADREARRLAKRRAALDRRRAELEVIAP